jgi:hypothetical protein
MMDNPVMAHDPDAEDYTMPYARIRTGGYGSFYALPGTAVAYVRDSQGRERLVELDGDTLDNHASSIDLIAAEEELRKAEAEVDAATKDLE